MLKYLHTNYLDDYEYFHICGDDTYLVVDNLRAFVSSLNDTQPLYIGGPIRPFWKNVGIEEFYYNGGGPGYTLNRAALDLFITKGMDNAACHPNLIESAEDLYMGQCFWRLGLRSYDARDEQGTPRYHHYDPQFLFDPSQVSMRLRQFHNRQYRWLKHYFNHTAPKHGLGAVSSESIAFHLIKTPSLMRRIHVLLYAEYREAICSLATADSTNE